MRKGIVRTNRRRSRRGFTLLEVLIVAGILALLAAFVVPSLLGTATQAKLKMAEAAIGRAGPFATQLDKFKFDTGQYPENLIDLINRPSYIEVAEDGEDPWKGPYIQEEKMLKDPWGKDYQYKSPGDVHEDGFDLWSMGPDMKDGTDDDKCNWTKK